MNQRSLGIDRRRFLRGVGAAIALPAFESLRPASLWAAEPGATLATTTSGAPLRTAFVFFPNGAIPDAWWPQGEATQFDWSRTLQPLEPFKNFVQVLGGLDHRNAEPGPDGAGDHARGGGTFLTGVRLKKSATDIRAGISIDQALAREVGHLTRLSSLELTCDAVRKSGACDSGYACAYQFNLSWSSPTTPMTPEANPRLAFERLFGEGPPGERKNNLLRRRQEQRSVLDFVREDAKAMQRRLGARDNDKLDQYLTGIREIETRIAKAEAFGDSPDPGVDAPSGVPADYAEYVRLMYDLLLLAFQSDSTRVGTLLLAHDGSNRSFEDIGISEGHHDLTHHQNRAEWIAKVSDIDLWYARQFAGFLDRLKKTVDVDGNSLLHN
ncbi:MAG TPA: DUF1552 domain-containing protein, partial [Pirellulales bacterium]|nr:DUF1552 domain-containing protein [Pirellulales bacterium]